MTSSLKTRMEDGLRRHGLTYHELDTSRTVLAGKILSALMELIRTEDQIVRIAEGASVHLDALVTQVTDGKTDHGETAGYALKKAGQVVEAAATRDGHHRTFINLVEVYKSQRVSE